MVVDQKDYVDKYFTLLKDTPTDIKLNIVLASKIQTKLNSLIDEIPLLCFINSDMARYLTVQTVIHPNFTVYLKYMRQDTL